MALICCVTVAIVITGKHRKRQNAFINHEISSTPQIELDTVKLPSIQTTKTNPTTSLPNVTLSTMQQIQDPYSHHEAVQNLDEDPGSPNKYQNIEESFNESETVPSSMIVNDP